MNTINTTAQGEFLPLLTAKEAAERLKMSRAKVYRLMATGELESVPLDGNRRIEQAALHAYLAKKKGGKGAS